MTNNLPLQAKVTSLKFQQRCELVSLVSRHTDLEERAKHARSLIQELAMHRVFDRFSNPQHQQLLDLLEPLAYPPELPDASGAFGIGAYSKLTIDG